jgi:heme exporter protein D
MYHLQVLKWISEHKISLGLINLEIRLGNNSSWHSFLALMDFGFKTWSTKYYLSNILIAVITVQVISQKTLSLSNLFLFLSVCYLMLFSYLHPFNNGIIFNHLGNPEVDIASMILFFFSIYLFLKLAETNFGSKELTDLLSVMIFLSISTKLSNIGLVLIPFYIFFKYKQYFFLNSTHYVIILASFLWAARSFLISGCFLFPVKFTCISTPWLESVDKIEHFSKIIMGFARDTRLRDKYTNFDYIIDSNQWILPWFNDYFLNTSLLKISAALLFLSIFLAILFLILNKSFYIHNIIKKNFLFILIYFIISILIWFQAPEIRFGWGWIISLPCLVISGLIFHLPYIKSIKKLYFTTVLAGLFILLASKHLEKFQIQNLILNKKIYSYEKIVKIGNYNNVEFYQSTNHQCLDFIKVCVNQSKKKYSILSIFDYKIYLSEDF